MHAEYTKTIRVLQAGQPGTKKVSRIYGDALVCIRYKRDYKKKRQYKTIELILDEKQWQPSKNDTYSSKPVYVRIQYGEIELGRKVKEAGGVWNREKKLWVLPLRAVLDLDLEDRIVDKLAIYKQLKYPNELQKQ